MSGLPPHLITGWWERVKSLSRDKQPLEWAEAMFHLGLLQRIAEMEPRDDNVELAIKVYEKALEVRTRGEHPVLWAETMVNLANAWTRRTAGDPAENRRRAIGYLESAIAALDPAAEAERWGISCYNLAATLLEDGNDDPQDIARAIAALGQALSVFDRESSPEYWAAATFSLAIAQARRRDDPTESVELAIDALRAVGEVRTRDKEPGRWADLVHQLGVCHLRRQLGDADRNVERAIACFEGALEVRTPEARPELFAQSTDHRGTAYLRRLRGDRAENVEEAIRCYRRALEVRRREQMPEAWAATTMNLATAYRNRIRGDRAENLETARRLCLDALEVRTRDSDPLGWATVHMNLGIIYGHRVRGDRMANLELAIRSYELALEVQTPEQTPTDWALTLMNLGTVYLMRRQGDPAENLERAIEAFRDTLRVRTREGTPVDWSISMANLGGALARRRRGNRGPAYRAENATEAIATLEAALTIQTREAMPYQWVQTYGNLGSAYTWLTGGDPDENLERARTIFEEILEVVQRDALPLEWAHLQANLGHVYGRRRRGGRRHNVTSAIGAYEKALEVYRPELLPAQTRRAAHQLGDLCAREKRWRDAARSYRRALAAAETIYRASALLESRQAEQASAPELEHRAGWVFARIGDLEGAVVALERGRTRSSREVLERDRADLGTLRRKRPGLFAAFRDAAAAVRDFEAQQRAADVDGDPARQRFTTLHGRAEALRDDLERAIQAIRAVPGHERFLDLPGPEEISQAVMEGTALLYLVVSVFGSLALLARSSGEPPRLLLESFRYDPFTLGDLDDLLVERQDGEAVGGYLIDQFRLAGDPSPENRRRFERRLEAVHTRLGAWLGPLVRKLRARGIREVALVASGRLALLPLHSARIRAGGGSLCLLDELGIRYVPSARVAHLARRREKTASKRTARRLVAVSHVGTGPHSLPYASSEVAAVLSAAHPDEAVALCGANATREKLEAGLAGATHLHLACHGGFDVDGPLDSGLDLADGRWTLRRILELAPRFESLRLVVLSACQTGLSEWNRLPDELIGLPAAFLQAGVPGVVAALWPADDLATVLLMEAFYQRLFGSDRPAPRVALHQAQRDLRELEVGRLKERFRGGDASGGNAPEDPLAAVGLQMLGRLVVHGLEARPFTAPYWAPFYYIGA